MGNGIVIQTGNVPERERQPNRRFAVRSKECPVFSAMLVDSHAHTEGSLYGRNGTFHLKIHSIAGAANNSKAVRRSITGQRVVVFLAWTELRRKLRYCEETAEGRAGGIVEI